MGTAFGAALAALLVVYLGFAVPGKWFPSATEVRYPARSLKVVAGAAALEREMLALAPAPPSDAVIVSLATSLNAADYPGLAWDASDLPAGTIAQLAWRVGTLSPRTFTLDIPVTPAGTLAPVVTGRDSNWKDRITGVALVLKLPTPTTVHVGGVTAQTLSAVALLAEAARAWLAFSPWSGSSINTVVVGSDGAELPLPALLGFAATLAAIAMLALGRLRPASIGPALPTALATMFLAATCVLDAQWQWALARQVSATAGQFAGKSWREKHAAADDAALFTFIETVRTKLPATPARVFMLADAPYFRGRGAYHLYPHNAYFDPFGDLTFPPSALRPGDYLVTFHRSGVLYDTGTQALRWDNGPPIAAVLLHDEPGAAVYAIR